ncbi:amino acid permease-domain-containing protein [Mycena filopes]|nr:amino acid permease-domain-containing protein [Mycena filopes]
MSFQRAQAIYTPARAHYTAWQRLGTPRASSSRRCRMGSPSRPSYSALPCPSCLAYMGVTSGSGKVFGWFSNMTSVAGLLTWFGICVTYIRFYGGMKAQGYDRKHLPFASSLQPFAAWYAMIFCLLVCFFSGWSVFLEGQWVAATFVTNYLPFGLFPVLYAGAKYYYWRNGTPWRWQRYEDLDFVTNIAEIEADSYDDPPPRNKLEAFWAWLM